MRRGGRSVIHASYTVRLSISWRSCQVPKQLWGCRCLPHTVHAYTVQQSTECNECVTAISIRVLWRNSRVITRFFFSPSGSALCFRPVETRVQTPSGAEALGFSAANCYSGDRYRDV